MNLRFTPATAFVLAAIALLGHVAFHYPALPQNVARHFDWRGRPNGFSSKEAFLIMNVAIVAFFALLFWAMGYAQKLAPQFVNIPNKAYWLSAERREASMAFITNWARWLLALVMALNVLLMGSLLHANLSQPIEIGDSPLYETAAFFGIFAGMVVWLLRRFPRPPAQ